MNIMFGLAENMGMPQPATQLKADNWSFHSRKFSLYWPITNIITIESKLRVDCNDRGQRQQTR
jgi:hypothetical protein